MEVLREFILLVTMVTIHITIVTSMGMGDMLHNSIGPSLDPGMCRQPKTRVVYYTGKGHFIFRIIFL